jgi:alpha-beta hydrolase superfamily lysophospholipase
LSDRAVIGAEQCRKQKYTPAAKSIGIRRQVAYKLTAAIPGGDAVSIIGLKWALLALASLAVLVGGRVFAAILFGTAAIPKAMASVSAPMLLVDYSDMPKSQYLRARDGATLSYRLYPHEGDRVVVLIHGSSGVSAVMHVVARGLAQAGYTVYVPDLRGHADDGQLGDIDYPGQLDDDLVDLVQVVRHDHPGARVALVGHSSGGGFALRIAEGPNSELFARYVLLAPALHYGAPTWRPNAGGWATPFVPRIIGLNILDRLGVTWLQHLPVVAFAVDPSAPVRLALTYSFVMQRNFSAPNDDLARFGGVGAPVALLIGAQDEIFYADRYSPLLGPLRPATTFQVVPGVDHMGLITQPAAIAAIVATLR